MISWSDVKSLQAKKKEYQIELNNLLHSGNASEDLIGELRSEIKHLENQIKKILGSKELKRQKELKAKKSGNVNDIKAITSYNNFKIRYDMIKDMNTATNKMMAAIARYKQSRELESSLQMVKVK